MVPHVEVASIDTTIVEAVLAEVVVTTGTVQGTMMTTILVALATTHMIAVIAVTIVAGILVAETTVTTMVGLATSTVTLALAMIAMEAVETTDVGVDTEMKGGTVAQATATQHPETRANLTPAEVDPTSETTDIPVGNYVQEEGPL